VKDTVLGTGAAEFVATVEHAEVSCIVSNALAAVPITMGTSLRWQQYDA
jgi:orotate phosphoribosyltransferase